jgi:hypothetical protein
LQNWCCKGRKYYTEEAKNAAISNLHLPKALQFAKGKAQRFGCPDKKHLFLDFSRTLLLSS